MEDFQLLRDIPGREEDTVAAQSLQRIKAEGFASLRLVFTTATGANLIDVYVQPIGTFV